MVVQDGLGCGQLRGADQEGQSALRFQQAGGGWQDGLESFYGAQRDYIKDRGQEGIDASVLYIDIRQCKGADQFAEKGRFLVIRFDERD